MGLRFEIMDGIRRRFPIAQLDRADAATSGLIDTWDVALDIKTLFRQHWFAAEFEHAIGFYSSQEIARFEAESGNLASGYLLIGNCGNGDRVYLDMTDQSVHYWSHSRASDWDRVESAALVRVYPTIDHLLIALCDDRYIPWDSHSAREYAALMTPTAGIPKANQKIKTNAKPKIQTRAKLKAKIKALPKPKSQAKPARKTR